MNHCAKLEQEPSDCGEFQLNDNPTIKNVVQSVTSLCCPQFSLAELVSPKLPTLCSNVGFDSEYITF